MADIDFSRVNPATGPVFVRGAERGDSLVVDILGLRPGPQGVATTIPGRESLEVDEEEESTPPQRRFT